LPQSWRALDDTRRINGSGCDGSRTLLPSPPIARRATSRMTFSRWDANGNIYLLVESAELTADDVRNAVGDADGMLQIVGVEQAEAEVVIWNADGSTAELSGNGTRIVAAWLAERTGADEVRVRVGPREVQARALADGRIEQELGRVEVGERETVAGVELTPVSVGNPHAVVVGDPDDIVRLGPLLENHTRFPERTNVQVVRLEGEGRVTARVWERGVGDTWRWRGGRPVSRRRVDGAHRRRACHGDR
jgi:diaminopimelate epimerase